MPFSVVRSTSFIAAIQQQHRNQQKCQLICGLFSARFLLLPFGHFIWVDIFNLVLSPLQQCSFQFFVTWLTHHLAYHLIKVYLSEIQFTVTFWVKLSGHLFYLLRGILRGQGATRRLYQKTISTQQLHTIIEHLLVYTRDRCDGLTLQSAVLAIVWVFAFC